MVKFKKDSGAALITALFIMALVAIAAVAMSMRLEVAIRRTELSLNSNQLYLSAQGVQSWAAGILLADVAKATPKIQRIDTLPQYLPLSHDQGIQVSGALIDEQGKFNLNNLEAKNLKPPPQKGKPTQPNPLNQFIVLLRAVDSSLSADQANTIAQSVSNWVTQKQSVKASSQYTEIYAKRKPPYQAAYAPMVSVSELRLVSGISKKLFRELAPYVTALPTTITKININSASIPVLMTLGAGLTRSQAADLVNARQTLKGFPNLAAVTKYTTENKLPNLTINLTVKSQYFLAEAFLKKDKQHLILYSLMRRIMIKNKPKIIVIWQSQGTL